MPDASPVIIDDGGSTRIRQIKDGSNMDGLLGTTSAGGVTTFVANTDDAFVDPAGNFRCNFKIRHHDEPDGEHHILPQNAVGPNGRDLSIGDTISVVSQNGQTMELTFNAAKQLVITLSAGGGVDPIVDAKQNKKQRRYVVSNAGSILTIHLTPSGGVAEKVFPLAGAQRSAYTMIFLK